MLYFQSTGNDKSTIEKKMKRTSSLLERMSALYKYYLLKTVT